MAGKGIHLKGIKAVGRTDTISCALSVRKRDGRQVNFEIERVQKAVENAFRAEHGEPDEQPLPEPIQADVAAISAHVQSLAGNAPSGQPVGVEQIQDAVEIELMRLEHFQVARRYILYRTDHARMRAVRQRDDSLLETTDETRPATGLQLKLDNGVQVPFDANRLNQFLRSLPAASESEIDGEEIISEVVRGGFEDMTPRDVARSLVLSARSRIERDPSYDRLAAQLQLAIVYRESIGASQVHDGFMERYRAGFARYIHDGIQHERLHEDLLSFDLERLATAILPERDGQFRYLGIQTLYDRYLIHENGRRIEAPQFMWMRVAMGLAIGEGNERDERAIEFYRLLSSFRFMSATPTLFNSGTRHPQLSSCYLTTIQDDLQAIFKSIGDNAMLSKWAGGLGNDWTNVRATGSLIKTTNGESQGVVPFLKVVNDAAVAVNQGGKRKGAVCAYIEPWHLDFEEFIDLRKNTGDDRRRTHDMHTAAWIPDLFMQRVRDKRPWTLFCPGEVPDLHDLFGAAFRDRYEAYERQAAKGELLQHRTVSAVDLWRKMLTRLFETGHPWVTFKDPSNIRSPQDHAGVVHSSNLCTEILLNTSEDETAVCNLGSINLGAHITHGRLDLELLQSTVECAMRMLDNVIDINFYPTPEARNANLRHRPVGLGLMGFQDALHKLAIPFADDRAAKFADESMEAISYYAILASSRLASLRGTYPSYSDSKWDRDLLPIDTLDLLEQQRGEAVTVNRTQRLDWNHLRKHIAEHGMRNSNCLAIAPTATISTIVGASQSIEPTYKHLYSKSNLSGEFTQITERLVTALKDRDLWDRSMLDELKYHDGVLSAIDRIPDDVKKLFSTAFEIPASALIDAAARRQKWLDQGQSLNLYIAQPSGKAIDSMYTHAWRSGLKTTYYLRSLAATQVEKSTVDVNAHGIQPRWMKSRSQSSEIRVDREHAVTSEQANNRTACSIDEPDCEACQ